MNFKFSSGTYATIACALNKPVASAIIWVAWRGRIRAIVRSHMLAHPCELITYIARAYTRWWSPQSQIMGICLFASSVSMQRLGTNRTMI